MYNDVYIAVGIWGRRVEPCQWQQRVCNTPIDLAQTAVGTSLQIYITTTHLVGLGSCRVHRQTAAIKELAASQDGTSSKYPSKPSMVSKEVQ